MPGLGRDRADHDQQRAAAGLDQRSARVANGRRIEPRVRPARLLDRHGRRVSAAAGGDHPLARSPATSPPI
jgi:hypothetical protein